MDFEKEIRVECDDPEKNHVFVMDRLELCDELGSDEVRRLETVSRPAKVPRRFCPDCNGATVEVAA